MYASPKHDYAARRTIRQLKRIAKQGTPLFGHQDDIISGHTFNVTSNASYYDSSDIKEICGDYPAVLGLDIGRLEYAESNLDKIVAEDVINAAIVHYNRGGIVTISWHANNPVTNKNAFDMSEPQTVFLILNDEEYKQVFMDRLAKIADILDKIRDSRGRRIPIIFRPYHEENNGFWWSTKNTSIDYYKALWRLTYNYLVKERGMKNLIWAYSPYNIRTKERLELSYPGDDYVDIVCYERYQIDISTYQFIDEVREGLMALEEFNKYHNKISCISECGVKSIPEDNWWTNALLPAIEGSKLSYILIWKNYPGNQEYYVPYKNQKSESDFLTIYKKRKMLFLRDL